MQALVSRGRLLRAASLAAALLAVGCPNVPPQMERNYFNVGPTALYQRVKAENEEGHGPYPGIEATLGTLMTVDDTTGMAAEISGEAFSLSAAPGPDGPLYRGLGGLRWIYNMGGRFRPSLATGVAWTDSNLERHDREFNTAGASVWAEAACDWMLTNRFGIGAFVRTHALYERATDDQGFKPSIESGLHAMWRF